MIRLNRNKYIKSKALEDSQLTQSAFGGTRTNNKSKQEKKTFRLANK